MKKINLIKGYKCKIGEQVSITYSKNGNAITENFVAIENNDKTCEGCDLYEASIGQCFMFKCYELNFKFRKL